MIALLESTVLTLRLLIYKGLAYAHYSWRRTVLHGQPALQVKPLAPSFWAWCASAEMPCVWMEAGLDPAPPCQGWSGNRQHRAIARRPANLLSPGKQLLTADRETTS